jgi:hypothetical protein
MKVKLINGLQQIANPLNSLVIAYRPFASLN